VGFAQNALHGYSSTVGFVALVVSLIAAGSAVGQLCRFRVLIPLMCDCKRVLAVRTALPRLGSAPDSRHLRMIALLLGVARE
jgi:hypothetical protein